VKTRQNYAAYCSIGAGIGGAAFSLGGTLAVSGYGARRLYVASKKLELIKAELLHRGIALRDFHCRDVIIPLCASLAGAGIGFGLDEVALAATNTLPMAINMPSGKTAIQQALSHPGEVFQGGVNEQLHEMALVGQDVPHGVMPGSGLSTQVLQAHTTWVPATSPAEHIGFYAGMAMTQSAEHSLVSLVAAQSTWSVIEAVAGLQKALNLVGCRRYLGLPILCNGCGDKITTGIYWRKCTQRVPLARF